MPRINRDPVTAETGKQVPARPHDSGSAANETADGLDATTEALRHAAEDTPAGDGRGKIEKTPVLTELIWRRKSELSTDISPVQRIDCRVPDLDANHLHSFDFAGHISVCSRIANAGCVIGPSTPWEFDLCPVAMLEFKSRDLSSIRRPVPNLQACSPKKPAIKITTTITPMM